jgi:excisionase family DNA binding protein
LSAGESNTVSTGLKLNSPAIGDQRTSGSGSLADASAAPARRRFLAVADAARLFGVNEMTLYRAIRGGEFPAIKIRGRYVVPAKAIDAMEADALATGLVDAADYVPRSAA